MEINITWLMEWIKKDLVYIILIIFTLLACAYTLYNSNEYQDKCNAHWMNQMDKCYCPHLEKFNETNKALGIPMPTPYENDSLRVAKT